MRFDRKIALVTGAGAGIGRATATLLSGEGAIVVLVDRDGDMLERVGAALNCAPAQRIRADCMDDGAVRGCVQDTVRIFGRIDILVNCVGGSTIRANQSGSVEELSVEDWSALVDFNLIPTFLFCRQVVPVMKRQRSGKIVNVASLAARGEGLSNAAYSAAKAGVIALTRRLSREVGPYGIHCNAISPGPTMSDRVEAYFDTLTEEVRERALAGIPLRRYATPEDQAEVIGFLASRQADFVTGVNIDVSGGQ